jgi:exopolysaccharide biosynthesis protein
LSVTACRVVVVLVDGRRLGWSVGMTTDQLARLMRRLGAVEAINLDGGASSQLIVDGRTVNRVAPGARRAVVSALSIGSLPASSPAGRRPLP